MKILAVGDLVGEAGQKKAKDIIEKLKKEETIDFIIVNGENVAEGMGITQKNLNSIIGMGANVVTLGNHTWAKKDIFNFINHEKLIRPANYPQAVPGKGYVICKCKDKKIAVINLLGRVEMGILTENPFLIGKKIAEELKDKVDMIFVDFHAEASAEKVAMGNYLDGIVTVVYGTHTHVQTADERILPEGTGYIRDISASLKRFTTTLPERYKIASGDCIFNGCIFEINDETCKIEKIRRLYL
jgi:hypothetical protein